LLLGLIRSVALVYSVGFAWFWQVCRGSFPLRLKSGGFFGLAGFGLLK